LGATPFSGLLFAPAADDGFDAQPGLIGKIDWQD
jgi:hypothetical protein